MFLKNYTSDVAVHVTIGRIEQVLLRCGVTGITKEYGAASKIVAITFHIDIHGAGQRVAIRLPADEKKAQEALWLDYVGTDKLTNCGTELCYNPRKRKKKADFAPQAERTAWKLIQDWVEVQLSMIQLKQAEFEQVFLPYVWDGRQTFYARLKDEGFRAMLPEKSGV